VARSLRCWLATVTTAEVPRLIGDATAFQRKRAPATRWVRDHGDPAKKGEQMKRLSFLALGFVVALASPAYAQLRGNGMPSGAHYNLNIHAHENCPGDPLKGGNRHTIFTKLGYSDTNPDNVVGNDGGNIKDFVRINKIFLYPGEFQVLDGNACDGDGAAFQLPRNGTPLPGQDNVLGTSDDVLSGAVYEIYLRELGKPQGNPNDQSFLTTCGISAGEDGIRDTVDDEVVCSSEQVVMFRDKGQPKAQNVTMQLTTLALQVDTTDDDIFNPTLTRVSIFDPLLYQYFWDYDNHGLRLVQLRFYLLN
jgi:hypothetical protein